MITPMDPEYYDKAYFDTGSKEMVDKTTGKKKVWGYKGTDWAGNYFIIKGLLKIFNGEIGSVLDMGCGQGSFTDYAIRMGLFSKGYDFSKYAIETAHHNAKGHIFQADVCDGISEDDNSFDLIFCSDMVEHIKKSKEPIVIKEFYRVTKKWVFLQFPVATNEREVFDAETDGEDNPCYSHYMIAGHLNMEQRPWWDKLFKRHGFKIREDLVVDFRVNTPKEVIANWQNIVILEK
jgi:SAM-dependent methyltransferase